jgi:hypothetical protein
MTKIEKTPSLTVTLFISFAPKFGQIDSQLPGVIGSVYMIGRGYCIQGGR